MKDGGFGCGTDSVFLRVASKFFFRAAFGCGFQETTQGGVLKSGGFWGVLFLGAVLRVRFFRPLGGQKPTSLKTSPKTAPI